MDENNVGDLQLLFVGHVTGVFYAYPRNIIIAKEIANSLEKFYHSLVKSGFIFDVSDHCSTSLSVWTINDEWIPWLNDYGEELHDLVINKEGTKLVPKWMALSDEEAKDRYVHCVAIFEKHKNYVLKLKNEGRSIGSYKDAVANRDYSELVVKAMIEFYGLENLV